MPEYDHEYKDQSYHGSPMWMCVYCGAWEYEVRDGKKPAKCPKAAEKLAEKAKEKEAADKAEYRRMLAERERFAELHKKYGPREDWTDDG